MSDLSAGLLLGCAWLYFEVRALRQALRKMEAEVERLQEAQKSGWNRLSDRIDQLQVPDARATVSPGDAAVVEPAQRTGEWPFPQHETPVWPFPSGSGSSVNRE